MKKLILLFAVLALNTACTLEDTREDYWVEATEPTDGTSSKTAPEGLPEAVPISCIDNYALPVTIHYRGSYIYRTDFKVTMTDGATVHLDLTGKNSNNTKETNISYRNIVSAYHKAGHSGDPEIHSVEITVSTYGAVHREKTIYLDAASYFALGFQFTVYNGNCNVTDKGQGIEATAKGSWPGEISLNYN